MGITRDLPYFVHRLTQITFNRCWYRGDRAFPLDPGREDGPLLIYEINECCAEITRLTGSKQFTYSKATGKYIELDSIQDKELFAELEEKIINLRAKVEQENLRNKDLNSKLNSLANLAHRLRGAVKRGLWGLKKAIKERCPAVSIEALITEDLELAFVIELEHEIVNTCKDDGTKRQLRTLIDDDQPTQRLTALVEAKTYVPEADEYVIKAENTIEDILRFALQQSGGQKEDLISFLQNL
jgi:hypothetical protein